MIIESKFFETILQQVIDLYLIPKHLALGQKATGNWIEKLEVDKNVIRGEDYTEKLVNGQEPGERPPISALEKWVQAKFGITGKQATSFAFAVANKIQKEGTEIYKNGGTDLLEVLETPEVINFINDKLGKFLEIEIALEIQKTLREL